MRRSPFVASVFVAGYALCAVQQSSSAALLTYWNFNNVSPAFNTNLGSFKTSIASPTDFGEVYTQTDNSTPGTLASNTTNGTVFNGPGIKIDFSNIATITGPTVNGKKWSDHVNQESTGGPAGYGTFTGSTTNAVGSDTAGNSLIFLNPGTALNGKYITLSLSSLGYDTLSLSYATRLSSAMTSGSEIWTYSTDGTNFNALATLNPTRNSTFTTQNLDLSTLSANALDNQSTFYLRMAFNSGSGNGSYSFDNLQLTGTSVPEPAAALYLMGSGAGLLLMRRRSRRA